MSVERDTGEPPRAWLRLAAAFPRRELLGRLYKGPFAVDVMVGDQPVAQLPAVTRYEIQQEAGGGPPRLLVEYLDFDAVVESPLNSSARAKEVT